MDVKELTCFCAHWFSWAFSFSLKGWPLPSEAAIEAVLKKRWEDMVLAEEATWRDNMWCVMIREKDEELAT